MRDLVSVKHIAVVPITAVAIAAAWLVACDDQKVVGVVGQPVTITASLTGPAVSAWARVYSGPAQDEGARSVRQTSDGGFIVAGWTASFGAGGRDIWVLKLDKLGGIEWQKAYGGSGEDEGVAVEQTPDGGYAVAGYSNSFGAVLFEPLVMRLDASGNLQWQRSYRTPLANYIRSNTVSSESFKRTNDGGYVLVSAVRPDPINQDGQVLKLDAAGNIVWQRNYGTAGNDGLQAVYPTSDGGYLVAGHTSSSGAGLLDVWVMRLDQNGDIVWQKTYGSPQGEGANGGVWQTSDGGYVVAGILEFPFRDRQFWLLRLAPDGGVIWERTYGGTAQDIPQSVQQTSDGGFVVAGFTESFGASGVDAWVLKLNEDGDVVWQRRYDSGAEDGAMTVRETSDGGYIVAAGPEFNRLGRLFVIRLKPDGSISESCPPSIGANTDATPGNPTTLVQNSNTFARGPAAFSIQPDLSVSSTSAAVETLCAVEIVEVGIDIKPGSDPNSINTKSKGTIPVAILSTTDFDATQEVDKESLTFGRTGDEESLAKCTKSNEDVNDDGLDDVVCHFNTQDTGFQQGDTEGILKGQTVGGVPIEGRDAVRIVH